MIEFLKSALQVVVAFGGGGAISFVVSQTLPTGLGFALMVVLCIAWGYATYQIFKMLGWND